MSWIQLLAAAAVLETLVTVFCIALCRAAKLGDRALGYDESGTIDVAHIASRPRRRTWSPPAAAR